jgi:hypothetical protein
LKKSPNKTERRKTRQMKNEVKAGLICGLRRNFRRKKDEENSISLRRIQYIFSIWKITFWLYLHTTATMQKGTFTKS